MSQDFYPAREVHKMLEKNIQGWYADSKLLRLIFAVAIALWLVKAFEDFYTKSMGWLVADLVTVILMSVFCGLHHKKTKLLKEALILLQNQEQDES